MCVARNLVASLDPLCILRGEQTKTPACSPWSYTNTAFRAQHASPTLALLAQVAELALGAPRWQYVVYAAASVHHLAEQAPRAKSVPKPLEAMGFNNSISVVPVGFGGRPQALAEMARPSISAVCPNYMCSSPLT